MNKSIKYIIPATIVTCFALTSCNGKINKLNRETYGTKVETLNGLTSTLNNIHLNQTDSFGIYKMPQKGMLEFNFNIAISGSVYSLLHSYDGSNKITNLNNLNILLSDNIKMKWDLDNDYFDFTNKNGEGFFITKMPTTSTLYAKYFTHTVAGKKYYSIIDPAWFTSDYFGDIKNYLVYILDENTGYFQSRYEFGDNTLADGKSMNKVRGIGFGISGFGGNLLDQYSDYSSSKNQDFYKEFSVINTLCPGALASEKLVINFDEGYSYPIKDVIDALMAEEKDSTILPIKAAYSKNDDDTGATMNFTLDKLDFAKSSDIIGEMEKLLEVSLKEKLAIGGNGTMSFDYFVNFKDNFIHQQEISLDVDKTNLQTIITSQGDPSDEPMYLYLNLKDFNVKGYINETVKLNECDKYEMPDTKDYKLIPYIE